MTNQTNKIPVWFWIIAIVALLWNLMGVFSFFFHVNPPTEYIESIPADEKALYSQFPLWTKIVFAIAVFGGVLGSIGLLLKKKWAKKMFIFSMLGIIPQMIHNLFFTDAIAVYGSGQAATMPIMVVILGAFLIWFTDFCIKKGWLR